MNLTYREKEEARAKAFESVWTDELDEAFTDIARYYEYANVYASLGLWKSLRRRFASAVDLRPGYRVLDVCSGTNAVGINLLKKQPDIELYAVDRSVAMQEVGRSIARDQGFRINNIICDVHKLPFPDDYFDVVTIQWATRHLRVIEAFSEIRRVLKPGGCFYHCDMLRPENKLVEEMYYLYLKACLSVTAWSFGSGRASLKLRRYFVKAIRMFYSTEELSGLFKELGYSNVTGDSVLAGMVAIHKASKA
jgi:demethylmenaquinone methyltransferase/2-methoxy-6-polyprenyl-1,4-benzoquinol methylase